MRFDFKSGTFTHMRHTPDAIAVAGDAGSMSWQSLRAATWEWMRRARATGASDDTALAILGYHQASFVSAVLGCVALGVPYVPLDCRDSVYQIRRRVDLARASLVYDPLQDRFITGILEDTPPHDAGLACILFTAHDNGEPLGVRVGRDSLALLAAWLRHDADFGPAPSFMACLPCNSGFSLLTLLGAMELGGTYVIPPSGSDASGGGLARYLATHRVNILAATPSFLCGELEHAEFSAHALPALNTLLLGGEPFSRQQLGALRRAFPQVRVINTYGCSEITGFATWSPVDEALGKLIVRYPTAG